MEEMRGCLKRGNLQGWSHCPGSCCSNTDHRVPTLPRGWLACSPVLACGWVLVLSWGPWFFTLCQLKSLLPGGPNSDEQGRLGWDLFSFTTLSFVFLSKRQWIHQYRSVLGIQNSEVSVRVQTCIVFRGLFYVFYEIFKMFSGSRLSDWSFQI